MSNNKDQLYRPHNQPQRFIFLEDKYQWLLKRSKPEKAPQMFVVLLQTQSKKILKWINNDLVGIFLVQYNCLAGGCF